MNCSFGGCLKPVRYIGLCGGHMRQHYADEKLRTLQVQYHGLTEEARFLKRVNTGKPDECWLWTGSVLKIGWHGQWRNKAGNVEPTHRAAWRLFKLPIPEGMCVLHRCDVPLCCNPSHLFIGSHSDNFKDMWAKGRARPGVSRGEKHGCSKLSESQVLAIRDSIDSGRALSDEYNVSQTTICDIRKRRIWKHI